MSSIPIPTEANITEILRSFPPLLDGIKLRWWPWPKGWFDDTARADALATIGRSVGLSVAHILTLPDGDERFAIAHECCVRTRTSLTLNYSPWHYFWKRQESRGWDSDAIAEVDQAVAAFDKIVNLLNAANARSAKKSDYEVPVDVVFLDQEILRADLDANGKPDPFGAGPQKDQEDALREKNDIIYRIAKERFPSAPINYHGQLGSGHHTRGELSDHYADTEFYDMHSYGTTNFACKDLLRRADLDVVASMSGEANWLGCTEATDLVVMPYLGIGGHYRHGYGHANGFTADSDGVQPYEPGITWEIARHAMYPYFRAKASGRADWGRITEFGIWPTRNGMQYWKNLICLFAGAHNIEDFEADWPKIAI
jgi:hypothetical protein